MNTSNIPPESSRECDICHWTRSGIPLHTFQPGCHLVFSHKLKCWMYWNRTATVIQIWPKVLHQLSDAVSHRARQLTRQKRHDIQRLWVPVVMKLIISVGLQWKSLRPIGHISLFEGGPDLDAKVSCQKAFMSSKSNWWPVWTWLTTVD